MHLGRAELEEANRDWQAAEELCRSPSRAQEERRGVFPRKVTIVPYVNARSSRRKMPSGSRKASSTISSARACESLLA